MTSKEDLIKLIDERDEWKARCDLSFEQRDKLHTKIETLQYEVDAIPAVKAERDDFSGRYETASRLVTSLSDALAKALKERDALKAELARPESTAVSLMRAENVALIAERDEYAACADTMAAAHKVERDALKDAARLALDALTNSTPDPMDGDDAYCRSGWKRHADASAALKAVL